MYESRLPGIIAALTIRAELTEAAVADRVVERAQERVPVLSGDLRDAIHKEKADGDGYWVLAGNTKVFYGHIVEHGSVHTAPHPFMVPAAEEIRSEIAAIGRVSFKGL